MFTKKAHAAIQQLRMHQEERRPFALPLEDYRSATATLTATTADDAQIDSDKIPKKGIIAFHFVVTGTNQQFSNMTRFQILIHGRTVFDMTPTQLKVYLQKFTWANYVPGNTDTSWSIPFFFTEETGKRAEEMQLEPGDVTIIVSKNATGAAGTLQVAWSNTDVQPRFYFRALRGTLQAAASQNAEEKEVKRRGLLRGIIINTTGLDEVIVESKRTRKTPMALREFTGIWIKTTGTMLTQIQKDANGTTVTDPIAYKLREPAAADLNVYRLKTNGSWAGTGNEVVSLLMVPADLEVTHDATDDAEGA